MIVNFPTPYEDEILYSVLARYYVRSGNTSITSTIEDLFGCKRLTAMIDFPCNLRALLANLINIWNISFEELLYNHTVIPLYAPFWPVERTTTVTKMMYLKSSNSLHRKTGVNSNILHPWKNLRFCPKCFAEDENRYGEAYWHRLHQVPGVLVCPVHKEVILDSTVPIYGINPQLYQVANSKNCSSYYSFNRFKLPVLEKLATLAEDTLILLNSRIPSRGYDWFISSYRSVLKEKDFLSRKGYIDQNSLVSCFIDYYSPELLSLLGLLPDAENKHNWVSMMARECKDYPHPVEHLLFMKFLKGSVLELFHEPKKNENDQIYEYVKGRYPCLNVTADHYRQLIITDINVRSSRNKNLIAIFTCSCGFVYSRRIFNTIREDINRYDSIVSYGERWENKFKELVEVKGLHLREVAKCLKVDLKTVRKHISRMNLESKWISKRFEAIDESNSNKTKNYSENEIMRKEYREKWIVLLNMYKGFSKSKLRENNRNLFYWLNKYDKEWLQKNSPVIDKTIIKYLRVDWEKRDIHIKDQVQSIVNRLMNSPEKPIRITRERIGKELHLAYILHKHLDKMPITKSLLDNVCESVTDFNIRKIKFFVEKLKNQGIQVKGWRIKQIAGLSRVQSYFIEQLLWSEIESCQ